MRILMTTDGSSRAEAALRFGAQIASRTDEPLTILTVIEHLADRPPPQTDAVLTRARSILGVQDVRTRVRIGRPAEEILREIEEGGYDLVILGKNRAHTWLALFFRGSTVVNVAKYAPVPIIVVRGEFGPIRRILLCDSGAGISPILGRLTAQLPDLLKGDEELTILHVMSQISAGPGVRGQQLRADAEELIETHSPEGELLERDIQVIERPDTHLIPKVRHGLVVDEILAEARSGDYDLVAIGAHRGKGWRSFLLDDLAHKIIAYVDRPVLIVR
ncbi:MAG: universal stress protein [Chloroflexi bacterium]|nr:universal stress protein [Chloroflexota bacterium]MBU1661028.1 universal stress protein [Chloroflexota bacterium]